MPDRLSQLQQMLTKTPDDPFLYYAIALEHKKAGAYAQALDHLQLALRKDQGYIAAYLQTGQTHELAGNIPAAKQAYTDGIAAATKKGDQHAAGEMQGMLDMLD